MASSCCFDREARVGDDDILLLVEFSSRYIKGPDLSQEAAIRSHGSIVVCPNCEKLTPSADFVLQKMLNTLNTTSNKLLEHAVVSFLRNLFEFQHSAIVETLLALEQSASEQIFNILLRSMENMDDDPDVAENACCAVGFLANCCHPYIGKVLAEFSWPFAESLSRVAHNDAGQSGLRMAAYEALHEVLSFVAAPGIGKLISQVACDLEKALNAMNTTYGGKFIQYECKGVKIILGKLAKSEVAKPFLKEQLHRIAVLLLKVCDCMKDNECWKGVIIAIGALAHAIGPNFVEYMPKFSKFWISGLPYMRAEGQYGSMIAVMIKISRVLKGKGLDYCHKILAQLHEDLFSTDLLEISNVSILCSYAELALAIGAEFHNYLGCAMDALGKLSSSKHDVLLKPESRHIICVMLETYFAIISCFEKASVSSCLRPFASNILDFLLLVCGLDMDARVTTAAVLLVRCLAAVPGDIFSSSIYDDESIRSFLNQCSISKDPLIEVCAHKAIWRLLVATYDLRWGRRESEISKKLLRTQTLTTVQDQEKENSKHLLSISDLPQDVFSYENNSITYVSLSSILSKDGEDLATRILAGEILLRSLRSNDWYDLTYRSRYCILKCLLQTISSVEVEARSIAGMILKHIGGVKGGFDIIWDKLGKFLCSDVDHRFTLEIFAGALKNLEEFSDGPSSTLINELHSAIFLEASEYDDDVILNWLQILNYTHFSPDDLSYVIHKFIFRATKSPKVKIKVAALECLTAICSRYVFDPPEDAKVSRIIFKAMDETDECVAYQAIVFWIVCRKGMWGDDYDIVMKTAELLVALLLKILFTRCTQLLAPTYPDQHKETPKLAKAAFRCLHSVAQIMGNKIIQLVEKVLLCIESSNVWEKEAGIQAFGSILVGPTREALSSLITSAFSKMLHDLEGCTDVCYAVTWTLSQIFELHHPIAKTLIITKYQHVIPFLKLRITDVPVVAKNACHALSSLVQGVDAYIWENLSPHFDVLVHSLYAVGHTDSVGFLELNVAAYEALHEFMKCADNENFEVMRSLTTIIMNDLSHALEVKEYTVEGLKNQCRSLLVLTQKLGTSEKYKPYYMQHVHHLITLLTRVLECENVIVCKEAMLAVGAIAYVNGGAFEQHMEKLEKFWEVGAQFFRQHMDVYVVMLSVIVDVCRALEKKMLQFCENFLIPLSIDESYCQQRENWAPSISCICEIAVAVGDKKFLKHAMDMLRHKTWFGTNRGNILNVGNILDVRPGLVEAYRAIFRGLENNSVSDPSHQFADDTRDVLLKFSKYLYETNDMDHAMTRRVVEVLEHLTNRKECCMRDLISERSPLRYSEFDQGLVDHLCEPRPSLIELVQNSSQSESSDKKKKKLVGGCKLVEVYSMHVKTEQACDLYGTIKVNAAMVSRCLYNQERGDAEPVSSGETALFLNVREIIPGVEGITLEVDLKHKVRDGGAPTDDEVCKNKTTIISGGDAHKGYNRPLEATIEGKIGSVKISFIKFDCAIPTYVMVSVVLPPKGIHGQITVHNMGYPSTRRELFRRNSANGIEINSKNSLKVNLCEGVVVVPLNSIFVVKADLWCIVRGHKMGQSSIPFMKFSAEFNVTQDGSTSKAARGQGDYGRGSTIIVEVHFGI